MYKEELFNKIGFSIRAARENHGWTQTELANKAGISVPFLSNIERGGKGISLPVLYRLAQELSVSIDTLILGPNPPSGNADDSAETQEPMDEHAEVLQDIVEDLAAYKNCTRKELITSVLSSGPSLLPRNTDARALIQKMYTGEMSVRHAFQGAFIIPLYPGHEANLAEYSGLVYDVEDILESTVLQQQSIFIPAIQSAKDFPPDLVKSIQGVRSEATVVGLDKRPNERKGLCDRLDALSASKDANMLSKKTKDLFKYLMWNYEVPIMSYTKLLMEIHKLIDSFFNIFDDNLFGNTMPNRVMLLQDLCSIFGTGIPPHERSYIFDCTVVSTNSAIE